MKPLIALCAVLLLAGCINPDGTVTAAECAQAQAGVEGLRMEHAAGKVSDDTLRRAALAADLYCAGVIVTAPEEAPDA
jgi:hypothetical protein